MKFTPHPYQTHTINFIENHTHAAILLGMGMGKTVTTLTALNTLIHHEYATTKALIIAPLRVARDTWPEELAKWDHLADLTPATILGTKAQRERAVATEADVYITNRENIPWLVNHCWPNWPFDTVVIDELSSFKNHQSARFKALKKARPKIDRIYGLTGTPAPNSLLDLWAPFRLLDGGTRLGKFITSYRDTYFTPDKRSGAQVFTWKLKPGADQAIYDTIADITLSLRTTDHLTLPEVTYTTRTVTMTPAEAKAYNALKRDMVVDLGGAVVDAANAATLSGKLQQLASGALYTGDDGDYQTVHARKLDALGEVIDEAHGNTVLVAYWFKHERDRILAAYRQARALDSASDFAAWNAGEVPVGLIHPASAGHGLNLQSGGHILVWYTVPWSLELYEQANARLHRQGQSEPVSIVHLVAAGTIDTAVLDALGRKATTQQALVAAVTQQLGGVWGG